MESLLIDAAFILSLLFTIPLWSLMLLLPHNPFTMRLMNRLHVMVPLGLVNVILILLLAPGLLAGGIPLSVRAMASLASDPGLFPILWCHILLWDLFVGRWIYLDALERGTRRMARAFCLISTCLLGPFGLLCYLALRGRRNKAVRAKAAP